MLIWQILFKYFIYSNIQLENKMTCIIFNPLFACAFLEIDLK